MQEIAGILVVLHVGDLDDDGLPAEERQVSLFQPTVKGARGGALRLRSYPRLTVKPHYMYDQRRVKVPNLGGLCCSQTNDPGLEMAREKWGSKLHRRPGSSRPGSSRPRHDGNGTSRCDGIRHWQDALGVRNFPQFISSSESLSGSLPASPYQSLGQKEGVESFGQFVLHAGQLVLHVG